MSQCVLLLYRNLKFKFKLKIENYDSYKILPKLYLFNTIKLYKFCFKNDKRNVEGHMQTESIVYHSYPQ